MNQTIAADQSMQMTLPLFQPLRFWTPKMANAQRPIRTDRCTTSALLPKGFTMKGGFVQNTDGVRRMIIAGKIVKTNLQ